jgi:hypothetical protein
VHVSLLFTAYASSYTHMHIHVITYIALIFWIKLKLKMPNFLTFYTEIDSEQQGDFKHMVISPLKVSFNLKRPNCKMNGATQYAYKAYNIVAGG